MLLESVDSGVNLEQLRRLRCASCTVQVSNSADFAQIDNSPHWYVQSVSLILPFASAAKSLDPYGTVGSCVLPTPIKSSGVSIRELRMPGRACTLLASKLYGSIRQRLAALQAGTQATLQTGHRNVCSTGNPQHVEESMDFPGGKVPFTNQV